jgi:nucleotide-binding universal stress UspA family protein
MINITRILVPLDFSDASQHAIEHAVAIAGWYNARLIAVHVQNPLAVSPRYDLVSAPAGVYLPPPPDLEDVERQVLGCLDGAKRIGIATEARVLRGLAADKILECATAEEVDLIVMGTHGATGFDHLVLGSTTEKVLRKALCPVLTIPPRAHATSTLPYERVLCAVDFSEPSRAALELALSLTHEAGASLTLLHVIEWPSEDEPIALRSFNVPEYTHYHEEAARAQLAALLPDPPGQWRATTTIGHGKPYREILRVADEDRADIIVMGVQGRNALEIMLFGSTTNQVVRRASCPVLTLRN